MGGEHPELKTLPPGQRVILRSFMKHGPDSIYVPSDIMDFRVCCAMAASGLLQRCEEDGVRGYELAARGLQLTALRGAGDV